MKEYNPFMEKSEKLVTASEFSQISSNESQPKFGRVDFDTGVTPSYTLPEQTDERERPESEEIDAEDPLHHSKYKAESARWIALSMMGLALICNNICSGFTIPLADYLQTAYDISLFEVNMALMIYIFLFPFSSLILAAIVLNKMGTYFALFFSSVGMVITLWVRLLISQGFWWIYVGNIFAGFTQTMILCCIPRLSLQWFLPKERLLSTTIGTLSPLIGSGIGMFMPLWWVDKHQKDPKLLRKQIFKAVFFEAIILTIILCIACIFYKEKPNSPPSPTAEEIDRRELSIWDNYKLLLKNCNANTVIVSLCCGMAVIATLNSDIVPLSKPFHFSPEEGSGMSMSMNYVGYLGAGVINFLIYKSKKYKLVTILTTFLGALGIGFFIGLLYTENLASTIVGSSLLGFFLISLTPICLEFGSELAYPVGEEIVACYANAIFQIFYIIWFGLSAFLLDNASKTFSSYFMLSLGIITMVCASILLPTKEQLRRTNKDRKIIKAQSLEKETNLLTEENYTRDDSSNSDDD